MNALAAYPFEITAEDQSRFSEALDKHPRKALPPIKWTPTVLAWIDNTHVALSARETPDGWKVKDNELARIIIIDTDTNVITDSPYRGELMCFSQALGRVVVRQPLDGSSQIDPRKGDVFLAGPWGQTLQPIEWKNGDFLASWSCERLPYVTTLNSNTDVADLKLLPGHGRLRYPYGGALAAAPNNHPLTEWLADDGKVIVRWSHRDAGIPLTERFCYLPWEDAYWKSTTGRSSLYRPKGELELIERPELLVWWQNNLVGTGSAWRVKPGTIWTFIGKVRYWRRQGIYMADGQRLTRVDDGEWSIPAALTRIFHRNRGFARSFIRKMVTHRKSNWYAAKPLSARRIPWPGAWPRRSPSRGGEPSGRRLARPCIRAKGAPSAATVKYAG